MPNKIKPIAIHLPQFHPFPENDEWWGKGFTEWTNVTKAKPLFAGHYQPHLPADLGFYDLRLEEARLAQIALAKAYGIYGFCYYHYWFNGKRLMQDPLDRMLENKKEDFPFMLCWANENWTRRWDGQENEVLIKQDYNKQDNIDHFTYLCEIFFKDDRYIKIEGKPFFTIYKPELIKNLSETLQNWKQIAIKFGFPGLVFSFMNKGNELERMLAAGVDYAIDFQPNFDVMPTQEFAPIFDKIRSRLGNTESPFYRHKVVNYKKYIDHLILNGPKDKKLIPGITPGWDNSSRKKKNGFIFKEANPSDYGKWLKHIFESRKCDLPFVFINAWNEWAEGNHLEPCQKWGNAYLKVTKDILDDFNNNLL